MQTRAQIQEQKFAMIAQWQQSGLSQKKYCRQHTIAYHHFHYWYKRYRNRQTAGNSGKFIPVTVKAAAATAGIELQWPDGRRLLFHQPVDAHFLKSITG